MHFTTIAKNMLIIRNLLKQKNLLAFIFLLFFMFCMVPAHSVPAYPHPIEFSQPDGTTITILLKGDEKVNWAETIDGYTILVTKEGYYEYAVKDEHGDLVFSGVRVSEPDKRSEEEADFLQSIPKALFFSNRQLEMMLSVWKMRDDAHSRVFPTIGEATLLCILMQTPDKPFTKTQEEFDALFNQLNYTIGGATGSVRDYYLENSYGQFDLTVDVVGPYTAQHNMAHYGSTWNGARQLATEAVYLANPDVDYADYDNTGNGWVEGFYMIFAGYGEEAGGGPNTIWSHAWSIEPVQLDGVWLNRYACSPELRGNSGTNITRIGVIGHELGHVFGAPDYYDTDGSGSGGSYPGTGLWDMMASGTWNNGGATPAHHNAYTKVYTYNWAEANILNQPGTVTLENAVENNNSFYRINTNTPGEYYLLENRHHIGFDTHIPSQGMIIYHVHREVATSGNSVNVGHPQKMYPVCAGANGDPNGPPASYGNINSAETPFPGSTNQTYFSDQSAPSMLSWAGEETFKPLTNISRNATNQTVSFDFLEGAMLINDWMHWDNGLHETSVGLGSGGVYQIAARFEPEDLEAYDVFDIAAIRLFVGNPPTSAAIKVWQGSSQENLQEIAHQEFTPPSNSWIEVAFDQAVEFDPEMELWVGVEYDDPGQGVFSASLDNQTNHDGKGNMIRMDVDDNESWVPVTNYNLSGDWNIQAKLTLGDHNIVTYSVVNNFGGTITAETAGESIASGTLLPDGADIFFNALPNFGYTVKEWTINGQIVENHTEQDLAVTNVSYNLFVQVEYRAMTSDDMREVTFNVTNQSGQPINDALITVLPAGNTRNTKDAITLKQPLKTINRKNIETGTIDLPMSAQQSNKNDNAFQRSNSAFAGHVPDYGDQKTGEWIKYWQNAVNDNAIGLNGSGATWYSAIRWMPENLSIYEGWVVTGIRIFMNDQPAGGAAMIWQGNIDNPEIMISQEITVTEENWVEVDLIEPYAINVSQELWIGWEIDDYGDGCFPASFEVSEQHDQLANLLQFGDNPWQFASDFGFDVIWNIEAYIEPNPFVLHTNENGQVSLNAFPGMYNFSVEKTGYADYNHSFKLTNEPLDVNVVMASDNETNPYHYNITFIVTDESGDFIDDAVITIGDLENEAGNYEFINVPMGIHSWKAERLCYGISEGEVDLTHDTDIEAELSLHFKAGDANGDGLVNVLDIILMADHWTNGAADGFCAYNADVDQNGVIDILDIIATVNIFIFDEMFPHPDMHSDDAAIHIDKHGISINSDGTLAGIQFEITDLKNTSLNFDLEIDGFELIYNNIGGTLRAMIFSVDNTPIPGGSIQLLSFSEDVSHLEWNKGLVGNLNAEEVPFVVHNTLVTTIDEITGNDIKIYPNPADNIINLEFYNTTETRISITNMFGQVLKTFSINGYGFQHLQFDLGSFHSGMFLLKIDQADDSVIKKIMVQ